MSRLHPLLKSAAFGLLVYIAGCYAACAMAITVWNKHVGT